MQFKGILERQDLEENLAWVKSHRVGIGQQWLPQLDVGIPKRPFPPRIGFGHQALQRIMEERNIAKKKSLLRKQGVREEKQVQDHNE